MEPLLQKIDLKSRRKYSIVFCATACTSVLLSVLALSVCNWIKTTSNDTNPEYNGLFVREKMNLFLCTNDMSVSECGYLQASKVSSIVSGLFGMASIFVVIRYLRSEGYLTSLGASIASVFGGCQFVFSLICIVYYDYLKNSYFDYDDINVEYEEDKTAVYQWAFIVMCISVGLSFTYSIGLYLTFVVYGNDFSVKKSNYKSLSQHPF